MKLVLYLILLCTVNSYAALVPTHADVAYGSDELNKFDFYQYQKNIDKNLINNLSEKILIFLTT